MSEARKYRKFTAQQKTEIVLASLRGPKSMAEVCREHDIAESFEQFLAAGAERLQGKTERTEADELRRQVARLERALGRKTMGKLRRGYLTSAVMKADSGAASQVILTVEDITERVEAQSRMNYLALHDELTGLPNRVLATDRLAVAQAWAERSGTFVGLLFLDLDGFKAVKDSSGHEAGDALLVDVARRLESVLRLSDTAARLGGDEFLVCCDDLGPDPTEAHGRDPQAPHDLLDR